MKAWQAIPGFAVLAVCALHGAELPVEFSGVLTANGKAKVALTDKSTQVTQWLDPGDEYLGYAIARYDANEDAVFLTKDGQEHRLSLVPSKTVDAGPVAAPAALTAPSRDLTANAIRSNLRRFVGAARRFQAEFGAASVSFADIVGPGKLLPELTPVAGENYTTLTYAPSVTALSVTTSDGASVTLDVIAPPAAIGALSASPPGTPPPAALPGPASAAEPVIPPAPPAPSAIEPAIPAAPTDAAEAAAATPPVPPPTPDAGDALAPSGSNHTVQAGDTLASIARANGMTVEQLQGMNPTVNASSLQPGQTIRIR